MLPLIESEIVKRKKWLTSDEYADMLLLTQFVPGVIAVNSAFFVAKTIARNRHYPFPYTCLCAVSSILGAVLPSIVIIILIASTFAEVRDNQYVIAFMKGVRPAVVALILAAVVRMFRQAATRLHNVFSYLLLIGCAAAIVGLKINPIWILLCYILGAIMIGSFRRKK